MFNFHDDRTMFVIQVCPEQTNVNWHVDETSDNQV